MATSTDRFRELRRLLSSYESTGLAFDDTESRPGDALSAYLSQTASDPGRAAEAVAEIEDLLTVGLFDEEMAEDVDLLPRINPPDGETVEGCLAVIGGHLRRSLTGPATSARTPPRTAQGWAERFPELAQMLGAYFHQDFPLDYSSHREALDDYISDTPESDLQQVAEEIREFLTLNESDQSLRKWTSALGRAVAPPTGVQLRPWLADVRAIILNQ
ncbi:contact-dependent growth inhibition system immunity protein [Streptomyces sp. NBC_00247]|uniref:contact-dependent growth inhibition system immunity protein n=1 Tax=Streptomyces sp. NBC_00247 TaxID=2975689 RepID=UPI002E2BD2FB|nr:contact-dependent growth inhibition system immunity protein [Streptomyces sp. NBC_00247]